MVEGGAGECAFVLKCKAHLERISCEALSGTCSLVLTCPLAPTQRLPHVHVVRVTARAEAGPQLQPAIALHSVAVPLIQRAHLQAGRQAEREREG